MGVGVWTLFITQLDIPSLQCKLEMSISEMHVLLESVCGQPASPVRMC